MSGDLVAPRPVAEVLERFAEFQTAYVRLRGTRSPGDALRFVLMEVLSPELRREVEAFMSGQRDYLYGQGAGANFSQVLADNLEAFYQATLSYKQGVGVEVEDLAGALYGQRIARRARMNLVDLAEDVATDPVLAAEFHRIMGNRDLETASALLGDVVEEILAKSSQAWTRTGQSIKIEQAEDIFRILARKAQRVHGDIRAEMQALWCAAVAEQLRSHRP